MNGDTESREKRGDLRVSGEAAQTGGREKGERMEN